jgi:hypothetical protein
MLSDLIQRPTKVRIPPLVIVRVKPSTMLVPFMLNLP